MKKIICISILILLVAHFENVYFSNRLEVYYDAYDDNTQMHSKGKNDYAEGLDRGTYAFTESDKGTIIEIFNNYDIFQYPHIHFNNEIEIETWDLHPSYNYSKATMYIRGYCEKGYEGEIEELRGAYPDGFSFVGEISEDDCTFVSIRKEIQFPHFNFTLDINKGKNNLSSYNAVVLKVAEKIYVEDFRLYQINMDIKIAETITRIQYIAIVRYIGIGTLVISTVILIGNKIRDSSQKHPI